jgi:AcrR family transcriptional regulator
VAANDIAEPKRPYELGKRLEQMDQSRAAILRAARTQLEAKGYRQLTMSSLAAESGVTRQTVHNLFGTKAAVLEALFDVIALDGGMENMRDVMTQSSAETMLERFIQVFCRFWAKNRLLLRRIHGIGAIDPEFGAVIEARNRRRLTAATRIVSRIGVRRQVEQRAATLAALTSFEFFDALNESSLDGNHAAAIVLDMARKMLRES